MTTMQVCPECEDQVQISDSARLNEIDGVHPNLGSAIDLRFCSADEVDECDTVFLATPHRAATTQIDHWVAQANQVIDLTGEPEKP